MKHSTLLHYRLILSKYEHIGIICRKCINHKPSMHYMYQYYYKPYNYHYHLV